jgi:pyruvate-ferredoxin/flavodoxin oxidoreductase
MGELADEWMAAGRKNVFGQSVRCVEMQSEAGAAGAVHGSCAAGALTSTYTASQGLLLMIPNMYKIAGERLPCVFHVAARALAGQALSIFGDHSDVMSIRATGWALLSSHSVQEAHDMAVVSHIAALESSIPFVHFFDGFRTSHEIAKIDKMSYDELSTMIPQDKLATFRSRALNPNHPHMRGTSQGPDIFFQMLELTNNEYTALPDVVEKVMKDFEKRTGRAYKLFDFYGAKDAENVIVIMGGGSQTVEEVIANHPGEKIGVLKCRLYRPWSEKHFFAELPKTTKRIAVLDRTKESGSFGEPLFLDVAACLQKSENSKNIEIFGGRYGLGSKDFTPGMVRAVYDNLLAPKPKTNFTVGIIDDVSHTSLTVNENYSLKTPGVVECMFWGLGADGTVGANKDAIKIIGENTDKYVQAYFAYDAKKSGGVTTSHLRFGPSPIKSNYLVKEADYVGCHNAGYVFKYDMLKSMKPGGIFLLNSPWNTAEAMDKNLPGSVKRAIAEKDVKFYNIDAHSLAVKLGLGKHINMLCQAAFFKLSEVLPYEQSVSLLKDSIVKTYSRKGEAVVRKNHNAVDNAISGLSEIKYDAAKWKTAALEARPPANPDPYISQIMMPVLALEGDNLPVSTFKLQEAGRVPLGKSHNTQVHSYLISN